MSTPPPQRLESHPRPTTTRLGQVNWTVLSWAVGVPLPIVLIIGLLRGCS